LHKPNIALEQCSPGAAQRNPGNHQLKQTSVSRVPLHSTQATLLTNIGANDVAWVQRSGTQDFINKY
jgi:hypothetical protein